MSLLVRAGDLREAGDDAVELAVADRLVVERGLQVLQRQRVVENLHVALRRALGGREADRQRRDAEADSGKDAALSEELGSRVARDGLRRLTNGAVPVDLHERGHLVQRFSWHGAFLPCKSK